MKTPNTAGYQKSLIRFLSYLLACMYILFITSCHSNHDLVSTRHVEHIENSPKTDYHAIAMDCLAPLLIFAFSISTPIALWFSSTYVFLTDEESIDFEKRQKINFNEAYQLLSQDQRDDLMKMRGSKRVFVVNDKYLFPTSAILGTPTRGYSVDPRTGAVSYFERSFSDKIRSSSDKHSLSLKDLLGIEIRD